MNVTGINLDNYSIYNNGLANQIIGNSTTEKTSFDSVFQSALGLVNETNQLSNKAEEEEIKYAMGMSDSLHDLQIAQEKANVSLQYTVSVKNTALEAYKTILNMQF